MIVASAGALLATSDPEKQTVYVFEKSNEGPRATLSASKPKTRYLLRARVTALGPEQIDTSKSASATVHGSITSRGSAGADAGVDASASANAGAGATAEGGSSFVHVRFGSQTQMSDQVSALTSFQVSRSLWFTGNCAQPEQGPPCEADIELDLELEQPGALHADSSVSVDWSVNFESRAFAGKGDHEIRGEVPWTIELIELTEP